MCHTVRRCIYGIFLMLTLIHIYKILSRIQTTNINYTFLYYINGSSDLQPIFCRISSADLHLKVARDTL